MMECVLVSRSCSFSIVRPHLMSPFDVIRTVLVDDFPTTSTLLDQ
jgi:hypothetical protein